MINPYKPSPQEDRPDIVWHLYELVAFIFILGLAIYGLCSIMYDLGIVVYRGGEAVFWFEEYLEKLK